MSRASESTLDALHEAVARVLMEGLETKTVPVFDKDGKKTGENKVPPSPQLIAQVIKFLATNGINAPATSKRLTGLEQALADLDLDEVETAFPN